MFTLRKRAKLEAVAKSNKEQLPIGIGQLPIEILYILFIYISYKDILKLRSLNKYFQQVIDRCFMVWRKRVKLKAQIQSGNDLIAIAQFLQSRPMINHVELTISKQIDFDIELRKCSNQISLCNENLKLVLSYFNVTSVECLNMFSNCCSSLILKSFSLTKTLSDFALQLQLKNVYSLLLKNLKKFELNCLSYHMNKIGEAKELSNIPVNYLETFFEFNRNFQIFAANLREFTLKYFVNSAESYIRLFRKLVKVNQDMCSLKFEHCKMVANFIWFRCCPHFTYSR